MMNSIAIANRGRSQRSVLSSMPPPPAHGRMLAIRQQAVRVATPIGILDAQLVKILRFDHTPLTHDQSVRRSMHFPTSAAHFEPRVKQAIPARQADPQTEQTQFRLRSVGEVLTDQNGGLYEVRGDALHTLGEVVTDTRGRMFEVCKYTNHGATGNQKIQNVASQQVVLPGGEKSKESHHVETPWRFLKALLARLPKWLRLTGDIV